MPYGPGTYGSKVGRPPKPKRKKLGDGGPSSKLKPRKKPLKRRKIK